MNARHIVNVQNNTRDLSRDGECRAIDPVWQLELTGNERLVCAACQQPLEELPEPMTLELEA